MSEPATEIVYLPMKSGIDLSSGPAKEVWEETLSTISSQPGLKSLFWGRQMDTPEVVQMVVGWESMDAHKKFMNSPSYKPFLHKLREQLLDGEPTLFHVQLPSLGKGADNPLHAPITECFSTFFHPSYPQSSYSDNFSAFVAKAGALPNVEAKGLVGGWSIESHKFEDRGEESREVQGNMFAAFVGWPSLEAHLAFRKTEESGKIIPLLRGGTKEVKVWHVAFTQYA